jgi:uncharacterized membrane protein
MTDSRTSPARQGILNPIAAIATIGVILIALGVAWVFISNWQQFGTAAKIVSLLGATGVSFAAGSVLERRGYDRTGQALYLLTALLWTLSVFIIAQQFHYGLSVQENTNLLFVSTLGPVVLAYLMRSHPCLYLALAMFYAWASFQAAAYGLDFGSGLFRRGFSPTMVSLGIALFYSGLGLYHRSRGDRDFARVYTWFAAAVILVLGFGFTMQSSQPFLAVHREGLWSWYSVFFIVLPLATAGVGILSARKAPDLDPFDAYAGLVIWAVYTVSAILLPLILGTAPPERPGTGWYGASVWQMGVPLILQWLYFNALFIVLMLTIVDFAAREHRAALMHLGLNAFGLYVFVRYVGFMVDLRGYLPFALMLILGGLGLVGLSIAYQRFRRFTKEKAA